MNNAHDLLQGCHRSHPHEEMDDECRRLTELARAQNVTAHENMTWSVEWVRPGSCGVARYAGTHKVSAPTREEAVERTRTTVARSMMFERGEVQILKAVRE